MFKIFIAIAILISLITAYPSFAEMKKPPVKETPTGGGTGGCSMSTYQSFYSQLRGGSGSGIPPVPIPGTVCDTCLRDQANFSRPWSQASSYCRSSCCP